MLHMLLCHYNSTKIAYSTINSLCIMKKDKAILSMKTLTSYSITRRNSVVKFGNLGRDL